MFRRLPLFSSLVSLTLLGQTVVLAAPVAAPQNGPALQEAPPADQPPAAPDAQAPAAPAPKPDQSYRAASPEYGFVVQDFGQPTADRDFALVQNAHFGWIKLQMPWSAMEPQRQVYDWSEADRIVETAMDHDLKIIARISDTPSWARADGGQNGAVDSPPDNYQDYADFIFAFVQHFRSDKKRVHAIEIWNEPNIAREWANQPPNPAQYVQLLKLAYAAAKDASPRITVLTGALTPTGTNDQTAMPDDVFLEQMYQNGLQGNYDVLSVHAAGYKAAPETDPAQVEADPSLGGHRFFCFRHVEDVRAQMVAHGDADKQIWITEFGWTSDTVHPEYSWFQVDENTKADYLVRAYAWAHNNWSPWIGVMTAWTLAAPYWDPTNEQYYWSVTNPDGTTRPAYDRLAAARASGQLP